MNANGNSRRIGISIRLGVAFALAVVGTVLVAGGAIVGNGQTSHALTEIADHSLPRMTALAAISASARQFRTREYRYAVQPKAEKREDLWKDMAENGDGVRTALAAYDKTASPGEDRDRLKRLSSLWAEYESMHAQLPKLYEHGGQGEVIPFLEKTTRTTFVEGFMPLVEEMGVWNEKTAANQSAEARQAADATQREVLLLAFLATAVAAGLGLFTTLHIVRGLRMAATGMDRLRQDQIEPLSAALASLGRGNLMHELAVKEPPELTIRGNDEIADMVAVCRLAGADAAASARQYEATRSSLRTLVVSVRGQASDLTEASESMAHVADESGRSIAEIAAGTERLAASLNRSTVVVSDLSQAARGVSDRSRDQAEAVGRARQLVVATRQAVNSVRLSSEDMGEAAVVGDNLAQGTVTAVDELRRSVRTAAEQVQELDKRGAQIGQIVQTISAIAAQTNLLALNAAIEAARAGEHGRGFAVVADEVRKLAEQSGNASREISDLINGIRTSVGDTVSSIQGADRVAAHASEATAQVRASLSQIQASIQAVAGRADEVARCADAMDGAVKKVEALGAENVELAARSERGTGEFSETIEQCAAMSEETAAGTEELGAAMQEAAAASAELHRLAEELRRGVDAFQLEEDRVSLRLAA